MKLFLTALEKEESIAAAKAVGGIVVGVDFIPAKNRKKDRPYFIVASTHGSLTNPSEIAYHPDRYILVSEWSRQRFIETGVETDVWQYPIEDYVFDKEAAQKELGLDPTWKHVLNVGLFSPGKNQGEIFAIATQLEKYKIKFHFVGNQAGNFEHYWKPLMEYKPENCIIWGERTDVDTFYAACDMFYFASKIELNPLSIKEALSYKLPSIFRKLHTYLDTYDNNSLVTYIDEDLKLTKRIILETLQPEFNEIPGWFSYQDLYDKSNQIAHVLVNDLGLVPGNRVLIRSANNPMMVACWFAILKAGGIVVATMPLLRSKELTTIIDCAEISHAFCDINLAEEMQLIKSPSTFNKKDDTREKVC